MRRLGLIIGIFIALAAAAPLAGARAKMGVPMERAVVKVITVASTPSYVQPWQSGMQSQQTGSGAVIEGGRILTNAHVVANQTYVQVQRQGDPTKYTAKVVATGHECDLAILEVEDEKFYKGVQPLDIGKMPKIRDKVAAYGFPIGGDKLSITEGVVSRVELGRYSHCWKNLLLVQIDAAINPGNSGGPVIKDGKIAGVAFQGMGGADNVGFMIPPPVILHFLKDVEDGQYDGFPTLGIGFQELENEYHRASLGMGKDQTGILLTEVAYQDSSWELLKAGDVILSVEGQDIANDGTVPFEGEERILFPYFLTFKYPGDKANLKILREGKEMNVQVPLKTGQAIISVCEYDVMPTYYVFGGMVFSPLSLNYLQSFGGGMWWNASPVDLKYHLIMDSASPEREQVVIMQYVLADEVNVGYHAMEDMIVETVNGESVTDLKDMIQKIESSTAQYVEIGAEGGNKIVLDAQAAREALPRILTRYRIPADRSDDLK